MTPTPRLILRHRKNGYSVIAMILHWDGDRLEFYTGETISPERWDSKKQRIHSDWEDVNHIYIDVNEALERQVLNAREIYNKFRRKGKLSELTREVYRQHLTSFRDGKTVEEVKGKDKVLAYYKKWMLRRREDRSISPKTFAGEEVSFRKFKQFVKSLDRQPEFESLTIRLFEQYRNWFWKQKQPPSDATIKKHLRRLKQVCTDAATEGITLGSDISKVRPGIQLKLSGNPKETIAIYSEEIEVLAKMDLKDRPQLHRTREWFVVACCTGLRFNRWKEIKPENIIENDGKKYLDVYTKKGRGKRVVVPWHPLAEMIFERNGGKMPRLITGQKFNLSVKELGRLAGFTGMVKQTKQIRGRSVHIETERYKLMTTHTGRRSFATNASIAGISIEDIMTMTGHTNQTTLLRYIKQDKERKAASIASSKFFQTTKQSD